MTAGLESEDVSRRRSRLTRDTAHIGQGVIEVDAVDETSLQEIEIELASGVRRRHFTSVAVFLVYTQQLPLD
jgi:hypothetical protein